MFKGVAMLFFTFYFASLCMSSVNNLTNGSFERGTDKPDGWSLSGGVGKWENEGYESEHSISVTGTGKDEDSNYWRCDDFKLLPRQQYRVSFFARVSPNASSGNVITGSNIINRDYSIGTKWEKRNFVFTAPDDTSGAFLRFGQWQKSGKVWFDNIDIKPVVAIHRKAENLELGDGETLQDGQYKFRPNFNGEGSNSSRALLSHTVNFNSNRWVMGNNSEVIYHHKIGDFEQNKASVTVEIGYYQGGKCTVEASPDGRDWQLIGTLSGLSHDTFSVPESFFPTKEIFVRLRGVEEDEKSVNFQIYGYSYEAELDKSAPNMVGYTKYMDILVSSDDLDVKILSLGDTLPNFVSLRVTNKTKSDMEKLIFSVEGAEDKLLHKSVSIPAGETKDISMNFNIQKAGDYELMIVLEFPNGPVLHAMRTFFHIPQLYAADYGYLLSKGECSLWWAEGTYKISKERGLPDVSKDGIYISAAKNEYEPFQLVLNADKDMENISIKIDDLKNSEGQAISADNIDISLVGYVYVKVPTDRVGSIGYWPDPLPPYKKPFSLKAGENQPLWITVYVPSDVPAGDYKGKIAINGENWSKDVDLSLHVWDFALPEETHVRTAFGFSPGSVRQYHNLDTNDEFRSVVDKYYQNFANHRISPYDSMSIDPIKVEFTRTDSGEVDVKVDFEAFDRSARRYLDELGLSSFRLPLHGMGGGTFHSRRLGEIAGYQQGTPEHEAAFTKYLRQVQDHLEANGWLDKTYTYWFDEPDPKDYDFVKDGMALIHKAAPKITRMLTEQPEPELYGYVEIWCPVTFNYNHERAEERRKEGEQFWWYVCTGPKEPYCTLFIDHYATEMRLWLWQTYKYKVEGILVWQSNYWTSNLVFPPPSRQNPYDDPMSYQTGYGRPVGYIGYWGNGDGRFLYPPLEAMAENVKSLDGPVNSIRWEMLREGIEDYEYFWLLSDTIKRLKGKNVINPLIDEASKLLEIPENVVKSMTEFTIDPKPIYEHRQKIAQMIEKLMDVEY